MLRELYRCQTSSHAKLVFSWELESISEERKNIIKDWIRSTKSAYTGHKMMRLWFSTWPCASLHPLNLGHRIRIMYISIALCNFCICTTTSSFFYHSPISVTPYLVKLWNPHFSFWRYNQTDIVERELQITTRVNCWEWILTTCLIRRNTLRMKKWYDEVWASISCVLHSGVAKTEELVSDMQSFSNMFIQWQGEDKRLRFSTSYWKCVMFDDCKICVHKW